MFDKLKSIEEKYDKLTALVSDQAIIADQATWQKYVKAHAELEDIVLSFREYKTCQQNIAEAKEMMTEDDPEMAEMAKIELEENQKKLTQLENEMKVLLLPKDPNDDKNVLLEIRAGTGGDEASLFAGDLLKMYTRYAELQGWKTEILNANYTDLNGIKEIIIMVEGKGAYSKLKYEGGVHRVQRVPATESSGRIHTSAATVAVLPEAEDVEVEFGPNDVRIDVFCASGPGGQCVNTTQSAVRLTHIPTGIVVSCQDEKSQHKNKDKGMKILKARVLEKMKSEASGAEASTRKSMVGSGDRSERIRTYNFPQGRVTDHRIGLTIHRLEAVLQGDLDEIVETLFTTDQANKLKEVND